jgi:hypothetical protein
MSQKYELYLVLVVAIVLGTVCYQYPSGEDWVPLFLNQSNKAGYFDKNSMSWSGNVVSLYVKLIHSDGSAFSESPYYLEGKEPKGVRMGIILDCQQHIMKIESVFVFLKEGEYSAPIPADQSRVVSAEMIDLCHTERPSWHLFRYKWFRSFFPSLKKTET